MTVKDAGEVGGLKAKEVMAVACLEARLEGGTGEGWWRRVKMGNWRGSSAGAVNISFSISRVSGENESEDRMRA